MMGLSKGATMDCPSRTVLRRSCSRPAALEFLALAVALSAVIAFGSLPSHLG
jgi:hypothetical protein